MRDKVFLDSNILIYSLIEDRENKHIKTFELIKELEKSNKEIVLSVQVIGETYNVWHKKYAKSPGEIVNKLEQIIENVTVVPITLETVKLNWELAKDNNYSYYDRLIIASAIENGCDILYSEDLHNAHKIKRLKIINPLI